MKAQKKSVSVIANANEQMERFCRYAYRRWLEGTLSGQAHYEW